MVETQPQRIGRLAKIAYWEAIARVQSNDNILSIGRYVATDITSDPLVVSAVVTRYGRRIASAFQALTEAIGNDVVTDLPNSEGLEVVIDRAIPSDYGISEAAGDEIELSAHVRVVRSNDHFTQNLYSQN